MLIKGVQYYYWTECEEQAHTDWLEYYVRNETYPLDKALCEHPGGIPPGEHPRARSRVGTITNRELLDNLIYGHYAHENPDKKRILDKWFKSKFTELFLKYEFCCILAGICDIIPPIVDLNKRALKHLQQNE